MDLARMRHEYETRGLSEHDVASDPMEQFARWLAEAIEAQVVEPNAMVVSTVDTEGRPHSRHVLLKGVSDGGFEFYTNYTSNKGHHVEANTNVALTFGWLGLHRQVNVVGQIEQLNGEDSDAYFAVRPRQSQLGAWASDQSAELSDRAVLEVEVESFARRFPGDVPRPPHWGGYRVRPDAIEFWQGRPSRLHDRIRYSRAQSAWTRTSLSP